MTHVTLSFPDKDDDRDVVLSVASPLLAVWLSIRNIVPRRIKPYKDREIGVVHVHGSVWFNFLYSYEYNSGIRITLDYLNLLLGKVKYDNEEMATVKVKIPMPESSYDAEITLMESTFKRPRWFEKKIARCIVDIPGGIPIPGKGDNSWDIDDDAVFSLTIPCDNIPEAVSKTVAHVLRSRWERSGELQYVRKDSGS